MNAAHILTLRAFLLALYQLPTIPPELRASLQKLPVDATEKLKVIYSLLKQEPLATQYQECRDLLQAREGKRNKADEMVLPDDDEPNDEIGNTLVAIETQTPEAILAEIPKIAQSSNLKQTIQNWLARLTP